MHAQLAGLCLLVATLAIATAQVTQIGTTMNVTRPVTVPLMAGMRSNSTSLDLNDPSLPGANAGPYTPVQVHLSPAGVGSVFVMWATQAAMTGQGALTPNNPNASPSIVKYGTSASALTSTMNGSAEIYNQIYNTSGGYTPVGGASALNYTSPVLHTVNLTGLASNTTYFYQVGDGQNFSSTYNFTALPYPGPSYPQRIIALADWGLSQNSTVTRDHTLASAAAVAGTGAVVHYIADFTYADTWYGNGTVSLPTSGFEGYLSSSYQPVWDSWMRMIEPLVSNVPMMTCTGNHEIEAQEDANLTIFASVQARWKVASVASGSNNYFFHSIEYGPVHAISLSVYVNYLPGSAQWNFLSKDLLSVNRTKTPWIVVNFHNPWYTTDPSYKEFEQMRVSMEPLFYQAGVDVVFYGHVHAYERSYPVYNYMVNSCGTNHITVGDAGNTEGLSFLNSTKDGFNFEDFGAGCSNITTAGARVSYLNPINGAVSDPWAYYARTLTFQADGNSTGLGNPLGYCYAEQPAWSAYREPSFGHGTLDILNGTTALWQWHRNQDNNAVAADQVYIVRDVANCANKMYPNMRSTNGAAMPSASS